MSAVTGSRRAEAVRLFEELLEILPPEDVHDFVAGRKVLTLTVVDGRLTSLRKKPIEEAFNVLNAYSTDVLKTLLRGSAPTSKKKQDWLDYILLVLFGRTYEPAKPAIQTGSRSRATSPKTPKPAWSAEATAAELKGLTSASDGKALLNSITVPNLSELARRFGLKLPSRILKPKLIDEIVYAVITGPRTLDRAQNG